MDHELHKHSPAKHPSAANGEKSGGAPGNGDVKADHGHHGHDHHAHGDEVKPPVGAKYFCPMCEGVVSDKPGDCPKCGMALERNHAWVAPAAGKTTYT